MDWVLRFSVCLFFFAFFHFQRGRSDAPADDVCENLYLLEISIDFEMMLRGVERVGFWGFLQRDLWGELQFHGRFSQMSSLRLY